VKNPNIAIKIEKKKNLMNRKISPLNRNTKFSPIHRSNKFITSTQVFEAPP
jgi:hypothetical protein